MNLPLNKNNDSPNGESLDSDPRKSQLAEIIYINGECHEIKLLMENNKVIRIISKEQISIAHDMNIEKICRQFTNQDILIKIRNGKKISIERIKITKPK